MKFKNNDLAVIFQTGDPQLDGANVRVCGITMQVVGGCAYLIRRDDGLPFEGGWSVMALIDSCLKPVYKTPTFEWNASFRYVRRKVYRDDLHNKHYVDDDGPEGGDI